MADYGAQDVICPFYKGEREKTIKCEGVINEICTQPFRSTKKKNDYKKSFCDTFNFQKCPYHKLLDKKYK